MTTGPALKDQDMSAQAAATQESRDTLSQQSPGIDPTDCEVAEQLVHHPQGRRDSKDGQNGGSADQKMSLEDLPPASDEHEIQAGSRRSSSQEQNTESQYSPITAPPVNGQMCR